MKVLVSPVSPAEAESIADTQVDVIDVKNVAAGSLGAAAPWVIGEVAAIARRGGKRSSAAIGDLPFLPEAAALAAYAAAAAGVDYVKAGLHGMSRQDQALPMLQAIRRAAAAAQPAARVVACGYADYRRFDGLPPLPLVAAAAEADCPMVMLDTAAKGRSLLETLSAAELAEFLAAARERGLGTALAGSLRLSDLEQLRQLSPDLIGIRGAVCAGADRRGAICPAKTREFLRQLRGGGDGIRPPEARPPQASPPVARD